MDKFETRFILSFLSLLCSLFCSSCLDSRSSTNKLPPRLIEPSPSTNRNADDANTPREPGTDHSNELTDKRFCKDDNPSGTRQKCIFTLDGYEEAEYHYGNNEALNLYVSRVVGYINETLHSKDCSVLAVTAWGYADSLKLKKRLSWADVPDFCRSPETCQKDVFNTGDLTNDDLACVRECLIKHNIYSRLEQNIDIVSKDWSSEHRFYTEAWEAGYPYRKVEIILERGGRCPND
jgi:hypothetical protein